jgi:hypothetical protein
VGYKEVNTENTHPFLPFLSMSRNPLAENTSFQQEFSNCLDFSINRRASKIAYKPQNTDLYCNFIFSQKKDFRKDLKSKMLAMSYLTGQSPTEYCRHSRA